MNISRRSGLGSLLALAGTVALGSEAKTARRPAIYGATPSDRQRIWHEMDTYAFIHFTVNTFTDREWGYGDESPDVFAPSDFSADQIARVVEDAGMKQLIITAKHHDGFCLWPSAFGKHTIAASPYKQGRGDIVGELAQASRRHGLRFGVYLSPWDRNHALYGQPEYVTYYHNQLTELLTNYGEISEVWFDGANGGDGYYGGANEVRRIDGATYYQWDNIREIVRRLQPNAITFADAHMDVRWVGNENGVAGEPCWPTVDGRPFTRDVGNHGVKGGAIWNPAETDVSIRPGWFWHADENEKVRSPANLLNLYFSSVGRGSNLLLNLPPDRTGQIPAADVNALKGFHALLRQMYANNLSEHARFRASSQLDQAFGPNQLNRPNKAWAAVSDDRQDPWVEMVLPTPATFDVVALAEDLRFGLHTDTFVVEVHDGQTWREVARGTCIGPKRMLRLPQTATAKRIRLRMPLAVQGPVLSRFQLYRLPEIVADPIIARDPSGLVRITADAAKIYYGLGDAPPATVFDSAFSLPEGGRVSAVAAAPSGATSAVVAVTFDVSHTNWKVLLAQGKGEQFLISDTRRSSEGFVADAVPAEIVLDFGEDLSLQGFTLTPMAENPAEASPPGHYSVWLSDESTQWGDIVAEGEFANIAANRATQRVRFNDPKRARYLKLRLSRPVGDKPKIAVGSVGVWL